jgi:hypothetical protein
MIDKDEIFRMADAYVSVREEQNLEPSLAKLKHDEKTADITISDIVYPATTKALNNYKDTYDICVLKELDEILVWAKYQEVTLTLDELKAVIVAIGEQHYNVFLKYKALEESEEA